MNSDLIANLSWCGTGIILTIVLFFTLRQLHRRSIENSMMTISTDSYVSQLDAHNRLFNQIKYVCLTGWIILTTIMVLFHSYDGYNDGPMNIDMDMGASITEQEALEIEPTNSKEIDAINKTVLTEKEVNQEKEIEKARKKSRDEFSDYLKNSN